MHYAYRTTYPLGHSYATWTGGGHDDNDNGHGGPPPQSPPPSHTGGGGGGRDDHDRNDRDHHDSDHWDWDDRKKSWKKKVVYPVFRRRPVVIPGYPIIPVIAGRSNSDIDVNIKNIYNGSPDEEQPVTGTAPTSGGRDAPIPQEVSGAGGFSLSGLPSWALPAGALGLVLVLVLVMKK